MNRYLTGGYILLLFFILIAESPATDTEPVSPVLTDVTETQKIEISVTENRVSLRIENISPEVVLKELADRAGFSINMRGNILQKSLTTAFENLTIEETIQRLMSLLQIRNYNIFYNEDGSVKRVDIEFSSSSQDRTKPELSPQIVPPKTSPQIPQRRMDRRWIQSPPQVQPQNEEVMDDEEENEILPPESKDKR